MNAHAKKISSLFSMTIVTTFVCLFLVIWELICRNNPTLQFVIPPPSQIGAILWEQAARFRFHTFVTFKEMMGGFALALLIAFPLAWLMSAFEIVRVILQPLFVTIQCVPMFALAPIMVLWFGWSYTAIIVPTALMIFFPLTINIYQGLATTPKNYRDFFRLHKATPWQVFYKLQLPWSLPHLFAGFKIAVAMAGIGAVAGEWAGGQAGLGILMLESRRAADVDMVFGALFCVTTLSLSLYGLTILLEKIATSRRQPSGPKTTMTTFSLIFCLLLLGGCQPSQNENKKTYLMLDWLPNPDHTPLYVGIKKGFFKEQGIDLEVLKVADPSDSIPYLTSKQVDIALSYMPHTLHALSHNAPILPIGILIDQPLNCLIYRKDRGITHPVDLNNRVIGYSSDGYQEGFLKAMFHPQQIAPQKYLNISFDLVSVLATNQVDATYGAYWNIEPENLRMKGIETGFFKLHEFGVPDYYELIFLARKESEQATPDFIHKFKKALQKSIDYAILHEQEAFTFYLEANPDKSAKTQQWEHVAWQKTLPALAKQQVIDPILWNDFVDWLMQQKLINPKDKTAVFLPKTEDFRKK